MHIRYETSFRGSILLCKIIRFNLKKKLLQLEYRFVSYIREKLRIMEICNFCKKQFIIKTIMTIINLKSRDILSLDVQDVKNKSFIELKEKKTNKFKQIPLNKTLTKLLKEFVKNREDDDPLFLSQKQYRLDQSQVYRMLNEACKAVGVSESHIGTHTMRKTFGYHHYKKFKDIAMLQRIFNHSSPEITMRYIGINQDEINQSYRNFEL